jgi:hypothetical protein
MRIASVTNTLLRPRVLLAVSLFYLITANIVWVSMDTRPPFWDMAYHQIGALRIMDAFAEQGLAAVVHIPGLTGYYPPVYHSIIAASYALFGADPDFGRLANLPAMVLLVLSTYGVGRSVLPPPAAAIAGVLAGFYPLMVWVSREAVIDYWLAGFVAFGMWLLLKTDNFSSRRASIAFGFFCGLGLLTKATFGMFLLLPALWSARKNRGNALMSAAVALIVAAYWYVPQWDALQEFYAFNSSSGVIEGDPPRASWQALVFYVRALEGYQLFLPLFVLFLIGAFRLAGSFDRSWLPIILWIAGGWLGLLLMQNKDPRYSMPVLPAVALVTAQLFASKKHGVTLLLSFLLFQHYLVSFGISRLPDAVVLAEGSTGPHSWHWNLYTQHYAGLWGKPAPDEWKIDYVLSKVASPAGSRRRLGIIPDIPCFDAWAFEYAIALRKADVVVNRLSIFDEASIRQNDFILVSEGDQGFVKYFTPDLERVNEYVMADEQTFQFVESFRLHTGDNIRLYKVAQENP